MAVVVLTSCWLALAALALLVSVGAVRAGSQEDARYHRDDL